MQINLLELGLARPQDYMSEILSESPIPDSGLTAMQLLQRGDPEGMTVLYDIYGQQIYRVMFRMVRDAGMAEDLVQETFLRVWLHAKLFETHKGSTKSWLLSIAKNCAIDQIRLIARRPVFKEIRLDRAESPRHLPWTAERPSLSFQNRTFEQALRQLSAQQRIVFDLTYFEGFTQTEIAVRIGRPLGTVKSWLRTSVTILRKCYLGNDSLQLEAWANNDLKISTSEAYL